MNDQSVDTAIRHQHITAAAQHDKRHALVTCPRNRLAYLTLTAHIHEIAGTSAYLKGRLRLQRHLFPYFLHTEHYTVYKCGKTKRNP